MNKLISKVVSRQFAMLDYGDSIELQNHNAGSLTFADWGELLRLSDFIDRHIGHIRRQSNKSTGPDGAFSQ